MVRSKFLWLKSSLEVTSFLAKAQSNITLRRKEEENKLCIFAPSFLYLKFLITNVYKRNV